MKGKQIVAIDVGTSNVVIAVGEVEDNGLVTIRGIVSEPVEGVNAGRVENSEMVSKAIIAAKSRIEQQLGIKISEAYAGISGGFVRCVQVTDHVYVQDDLHNGSNQITQNDVDELHRRMQSVKLPDSLEIIIAMEPLRYKIDDKEVPVPVGAYGHRLTATYNFILCDKAMHERLRHCLQRNGINIKEIVPNAMIMHNSVATTDDMQDGAIVIDFGGGVTDVSVLHGGKTLYVASIPIGASSINADIQTLAIPTGYIEDLKILQGSAVADLAEDDIIVFQVPKRVQSKNILRKNLVIAIEARLKEIAEWVRNEIKEAGCNSKFMPTVLLTGGGAQMRDIEKLFSRELNIAEVRTVCPEYGFTEESMLEHITSPADATVASLLVYGAKRGSCTISLKQPDNNAKTASGAYQPKGLSEHGYASAGTQALTPQGATHAQQPGTQTQTNPQGATQPTQPSTQTHETSKPYDIDDEDKSKSRKGIGTRLREWVEGFGSKVIGDVEEGEY